jgi:acyl-CoA thioesterase-1
MTPPCLHARPRLASASILLLLICLASCDDLAPLAALGSDAVILAFGDSLTYGTGAGRSESYPSVLSEMKGRKVINAGVPGEITTEAVQRLPTLLAEHKPDLVIIIHGGNDMLRRMPYAKASANLTRMINLSRDSGADVVIAGVPPPGLLLQTASFYAEVAETTKTPINEDASASILQYPANKSDPVHPNAKGYRMLAEELAAVLKEGGAL